jgi:peptide/nickel transport system substrate-binding protein
MLLPPGEHYGVMYWLAVNLLDRNAQSPLHKLAVRKALALAVDKTALVQLSGGPGASRPLYQAVQSSVIGFRPGADQFQTAGDRGDPEAARRLLAAAGYPDGITLRVIYSSSGLYPILAQSVQASLHRAGISVQLTPYAFGDIYGRVLYDLHNAERSSWDLALVAGVPSWYGNNGRSVVAPSFDGRALGPGSSNYGGYNSPMASAAIDRALVAQDETDAREAWEQAVRQATSDLPVVPLVEIKRGMMRAANVKNCLWLPAASQCDLVSVWLADASRQ